MLGVWASQRPEQRKCRKRSEEVEQKLELISRLFDCQKLPALMVVEQNGREKLRRSQRGHGRSTSSGVWIGCTLPIRKSRTAACERHTCHPQNLKSLQQGWLKAEKLRNCAI